MHRWNDGNRRWRPRIACLLCFLIATAQPAGYALGDGPSIPGFHGAVPNTTAAPSSNALPAVRNVVQGVSAIEQPAENRLIVRQDQKRAIVEWDSFDIGEQAWTHFDQKGNADWAALNRIYDRNPSQIYGRLTSDGRVFLINQNGILFGPGSRVDVGSLTASALNLRDQDFQDNLLRFRAENFTEPDSPANLEASVVNSGAITTGTGGSVFLVAPSVANEGSIDSPTGQIGLAAGEEVKILATPDAQKRLARIVDVHTGGASGEAVNRPVGQLAADSGLVGMYGKVVNQQGLVRSVRTLQRGGNIELCAAEKVVTGKDSRTLSPVSDSEEAIVGATFQPSRVSLWGLALDSSDPTVPRAPAKTIEHCGTIEAPSGVVTLKAEDRVYLENGSRIDVGGLWVERPAEKNLVKTQLNSVELADDFGQKEGVLKGGSIAFNAREGSAIGHVEGALATEAKTAREMSTQGGTIEISSTAFGSGDLIVKEGAELDFSGGGFSYGKGHADTTMLRSGLQVYDVSEAPQWVRYDAILGLHEKRHERYGVLESFEGVYYGGAAPLRQYWAAHIEGEDAGTLKLDARTLVLDGRMDGSVGRGIFQTEEGDPEDEYGFRTARGLREPRGGKLQIGSSSGSSIDEIDFMVGEIVVKRDVAPLSRSFKAGDAVPDRFPGDENLAATQFPGSDGAREPVPVKTSYLSAEKLSSSGLSEVSLATNTRIKIDPDASISLPAGGTFAATANSIVHEGELSVPAGIVSFTAKDNFTTFETILLGANEGEANPHYVPYEHKGRILFADGSRLIAAGERIDNAFAGVGTVDELRAGRVDGGLVRVGDETGFGEGIVIRSGALLDVSGGFEIAPEGTVSGGDAGRLELQALRIRADGDLRGHALAGSEGGSLVLHAGEITVTPAGGTVDRQAPEHLIVTDDLLDKTGFSHVTLRAQEGVTVAEDAVFSPSRARLADPLSGNAVPAGSLGENVYALSGEAVFPEGEWVELPPEFAGDSSLTLQAGRLVERGIFKPEPNLEAEAVVETGARLEVWPEGEIGVEGPLVRIAGVLEARSGSVSAVAGEGDLTVMQGGGILAKGYNMPQTNAIARGLRVNYTPVAAGSIVLQAEKGNVVLEPGSLVDVSGSEPVRVLLQQPDGSLAVAYVAGDPGTIDLASFGETALNGTLRGFGSLEGVRGGTLVLRKTDTDAGMTLEERDLERYLSSGFDALAFESWSSLGFAGSMNLEVGRSLTLDAPRILGTNDRTVALRAPWVRLANSYAPSKAQGVGGEAVLSLSAGRLDVEGDVLMSGFREVRLEALGDIRLSEKKTTGGGLTVWSGRLATSGDLTLEAARVYPTTLADFSLQARGTVDGEGVPRGGTLAILPSGQSDPGPIYSAGGTLVLEADVIDHRGVLAAPMGEVILCRAVQKGIDAEGNEVAIYLPAERVLLAEGSAIRTAGDLPVNYGTLVEYGTFWNVLNKQTQQVDIPVEAAPAKSVSIHGDHVAIEDGSSVDVSGGGSVFAYGFQPGDIQGTADPLKRSGQYVILPDNSVVLPGEAVYLTGSTGVPEGTYSLLPEEFAFLPGALILRDLGAATAKDANVRSEEGYEVVAGYRTVSGTSVRSPEMRSYTVRAAADVLREGHFDVRELAAAAGGDVTIDGATTVLNGRVVGRPTPGGEGGRLALGGAGVVYGPVRPEDLTGKLYIDSRSFRAEGFEDVQLGIQDSTDWVTLQGGGILQANNVTLSAREAITLESESQIHAQEAARLETKDGRITIGEEALVHAGDEVGLDASEIDLQGDIRVDRSSLRVSGSKIYVATGKAPDDAYGDGLYLDERIWGRFSDIAHVTLASRSDLLFLDGLEMKVEEELNIDAARIAGMGLDAGETVALESPNLRLLNSGGSPAGADLSGSGLLALRADAVSIGHGDILVDGFSGLSIRSEGDLVFQGDGSLHTAGSLRIDAARVTVSPYQDASTSYENADFLVSAGNGSITIAGSGGTAGSRLAPGGHLEMRARSIEHAGRIEAASGGVSLIAEGTGPGEGIFLRGGSEILVRGSEDAPGGRVGLRADAGPVVIEAAAEIDVSAGEQGDAGLVDVRSAEGRVALDGEIRGRANGGQGGSFSLDTKRIENFSAINALLGQGGFTGEVGLRAREGDVSIGAQDAVRASAFDLVADSGAIDVYGRVESGGAEGGGSVSLAAGGDLRLHAGSEIDAQGSGAGTQGGVVCLGSASGILNLAEGSSIDVSGGQGGEVRLRALREGTGVKMDLDGAVIGASQVVAEAVKVYTDDSIDASEILPGTVSAAGGAYWSETSEYMDHAAAIVEGLVRGPGEGAGLSLVACDPGAFHFVPGIEVRSEGDLALDAAWDLASATGSDGGLDWRFGEVGEPGILTLRAAGDLALNGNILDRPTPEMDLPGSGGPDSWGLTLVAGADLESADPLAVRPGTGDLVVPDGRAVYTESGPVRFASGGRTTIGSAGSYSMSKGLVKYNLATYDGGIEGRVGGDLEIRGGAIQSAAGDISIEVGNDLLLGTSKLGSIRTLGERPSDNLWNEPPRYWEYSGGGDISLRVEGSVNGLIDRSAWDRVYTQPVTAWAANYEDFTGNATRGLATMGGGDLSVVTGGGFYCQAATFGKGDLRVLSGGNVNGRFLVSDGRGDITSMGDFGTGIANTPIEAGDARIRVTAQGSLHLGTVINPTLTAAGLTGEAQWNCSYGEASGIELVARTGDVLLTGDSAFLALQANLELERLLPPNLRISAGRDVLLMDQFLVMPSRQGNVEIEAGRDIRGVGEAEGRRWSEIHVSDAGPSEVFGNHDGEFSNTRTAILGKLKRGHAKPEPASGESRPFEMQAGRDIRDLSILPSRRADISAGRDIRNIYYNGQNLRSTDETTMEAGRDIAFLPSAYHNDKNIFLGVEHGGPGSLFVQAGNSIELGSSRGIQSVANLYNPVLAKKGSDLIVVAGYPAEFDKGKVESFFDGLREAGVEYSTLLAQGEVERAEQRVEEARRDLIGPLLGGARAGIGEGQVNMLGSQINGAGEDSRIFLLAKGDVNVGRTVSSGEGQKNSGIYTAAGGAIDIFSGGDLNVNESRVMTFRGGNITAWADYGNINAGRGSKTAISTEEPKAELDEDGEIVGVTFEPPAVGSGIRTLTYDPDGIEGPRVAPAPGDVYLFAPRGEIDAGEAGISGSRVVLGATEVVNAQNIQFSQGSVGVPSGSEGAAGLGALAGAGSLTETSKMGEEATLGSAKERFQDGGSGLADALQPRWLDVQVIDFLEPSTKDVPQDDKQKDGQG